MYNGWSSYETWLVNLWMEDSFADIPNEVGLDEYSVATAARELVESVVSLQDAAPSLVDDLLGAALDNVNWKEIAESIIADYPIEDEEEE